MKYRAKSFLDLIEESHHNVNAIWQMKSDVSFFITKLVTDALGGKHRGEYTVPGGKYEAYEINGKKFAVLFGDSSTHMHRAQAFIVADPSYIDELFGSVWDQYVELEDTKRVFTLQRRNVHLDMNNHFADSQMILTSIKNVLNLHDAVARSVQFSWRATQKLGKVSTSKPVLTETIEWENIMSYGLQFASTVDMLKNGTLAFLVPVWAVDQKTDSIVPRKLYADHKPPLDYVGRFVIGRKDGIIRWWDFYTNSSKRIKIHPGKHLLGTKDYQKALGELVSILDEYSTKDSRIITFKSHQKRKNPTKKEIFKNFIFKKGWDDNSLDNSRIDQATTSAMDDFL